MDYQSMAGPDGEHDNPGGTAEFFLYAPKSYFVANTGITAPKALGVATTLSELSVNDQDFTFKAGKGWHKMYVTFDSSELEAAIQGEIDGHSYKQMFKGFHPGVEPVSLGLWRKAKNDIFVTLHPTVDGKYFQLGDNFYSAYMHATKIGTAKNSSGRRGSEFEILCMGSGIYLYTGGISYHPEGSSS